MFPPGQEGGSSGSALALATSAPAAQTIFPCQLWVPLGPRTHTRAGGANPRLQDPSHKLSRPAAPARGTHQTPQILVVSLLQKHKPLRCGTPHSPALFPMKERGNSHSDHKSCPKNHLHAAQQPPGSSGCCYQHAAAIPFPHCQCTHK